jgi:hypothetical protein
VDLTELRSYYCEFLRYGPKSVISNSEDFDIDSIIGRADGGWMNDESEYLCSPLEIKAMCYLTCLRRSAKYVIFNHPKSWLSDSFIVKFTNLPVYYQVKPSDDEKYPNHYLRLGVMHSIEWVSCERMLTQSLAIVPGVVHINTSESVKHINRYIPPFLPKELQYYSEIYHGIEVHVVARISAMLQHVFTSRDFSLLDGEVNKFHFDEGSVIPIRQIVCGNGTSVDNKICNIELAALYNSICYQGLPKTILRFYMPMIKNYHNNCDLYDRTKNEKYFKYARRSKNVMDCVISTTIRDYIQIWRRSPIGAFWIELTERSVISYRSNDIFHTRTGSFDAEFETIYVRPFNDHETYMNLTFNPHGSGFKQDVLGRLKSNNKDSYFYRFSFQLWRECMSLVSFDVNDWKDTANGSKKGKKRRRKGFHSGLYKYDSPISSSNEKTFVKFLSNSHVKGGRGFSRIMHSAVSRIQLLCCMGYDVEDSYYFACKAHEFPFAVYKPVGRSFEKWVKGLKSVDAFKECERIINERSCTCAKDSYDISYECSCFNQYVSDKHVTTRESRFLGVKFQERCPDDVITNLDTEIRIYIDNFNVICHSLDESVEHGCVPGTDRCSKYILQKQLSPSDFKASW